MGETESDSQVTRTTQTNVEQAVPSPVATDGAVFGGSRTDWTQHLVTLRHRAKAAMERLSDYLHGRQPSSVEQTLAGEIHEHLTETLETISMRQDSLEEMIGSGRTSEERVSAPLERRDKFDAPPEWAIRLQSTVADRLAGFEATLQSLCERLETHQPPRDRVVSDEDVSDEDGLEDTIVESIELPPGAASEFSPSVTSQQADWLGIMLGSTLASDIRLGESLRWLRENVLTANPQALSLIGQMLVFRSAGAERKPSLLKDVGEAYYRCFPKSRDTGDPFEESLAAWSQSLCNEAGLPNSIELVHPGERFDAARHAPVERGGVEVAEVLGWVVLRDGGRVFSKASVLTR